MAATPTIEPHGHGLAQLITSIRHPDYRCCFSADVHLREKWRFWADDILMVIGYVGFITGMSRVTMQLTFRQKILFAILAGVSSKATYYGAGQRDAVLPEGIYPHGKFVCHPYLLYFLVPG